MEIPWFWQKRRKFPKESEKHRIERSNFKRKMMKNGKKVVINQFQRGNSKKMVCCDLWEAHFWWVWKTFFSFEWKTILKLKAFTSDVTNNNFFSLSFVRFSFQGSKNKNSKKTKSYVTALFRAFPHSFSQFFFFCSE